MVITMKELSEIPDKVEEIKEFIFNQIYQEYNGGINPEYHYDILNLEDYYLKPQRNNLFIAMDGDEIIASIAVRGYDKDFKEFKNIYSQQTTASIWRLFVDKKFRRNGLATKLYNAVEDFSRDNNYNYIYLHTHKDLEAALDFWQKMGFEITLDTDDEFQTVHMQKTLSELNLDSVTQKDTHLIKS